MDNYRPIALLSNFSKILEKVICTRLMTFLDVNNLISDSQFGFRKKHSTVHPLVHFMNFVSNAFNKKHHVISIFCDLRKAFDTVNSNILFKKLFKLGIRNNELLWFKNYLSDRKQFVSVNGKISSLKNVILGVPQGSILGPILFLLYINDLPNASFLYALLFADDTTLLASGPNLNELFQYVNNEFHKIVYFFRKNKLALHPAKTKYMIFSNSPESKNTACQLVINNNNFDDPNIPAHIIPVARVTGEISNPSVKFLGVFIDPSLNFKHHIKTICNKISSSLYFLRSVKKILSFKAMNAVYFSLIHSHLVYCIQVWSCCPESSLNSLFKKQKIALRIINNASYNSHTESLFKKCKILPLPSLAEFFKLQFIHLFLNNNLPASFNNMWTTNMARRVAHEDDNPPVPIRNIVDPYVLRNNDDLCVPFSRLALTEKFPLFSFPTLWLGLLNPDVKIQRTKNAFNAKLKQHFLGKLQDNFTCERLLCPHCHLHR